MLVAVRAAGRSTDEMHQGHARPHGFGGTDRTSGTQCAWGLNANHSTLGIPKCISCRWRTANRISRQAAGGNRRCACRDG